MVFSKDRDRKDRKEKSQRTQRMDPTALLQNAPVDYV